MSGADRFGLIAGGAVAALGTVLLLDQTGALELDYGWLAVVLTAVFGVILLVSGLTHERNE